jgi:hypothetical protein
VPVKREEERPLPPTGLLVEAAPQFEAAQSVAKAGVLLALPALLEQGLVEVGTGVYSKLKNGYYGLMSMLLTFSFMALLRIKSAEGLTNHAPGEFGRVLGLDRVPEMKTVRRKLAELAGRGLALEFSGGFTERWASETPDTLGYLYIDGHVRPYWTVTGSPWPATATSLPPLAADSRVLRRDRSTDPRASGNGRSSAAAW